MGAAPVRYRRAMPEEAALANGRTFLVLDAATGTVDAAPDAPAGLFHEDTRHLSRWRLTVGGQPLRQLSADLRPRSSRHVLVPPTPRDVGPPVSVMVARHVGPGVLTEEVTLVGHGAADAPVDLELEVAADFADQFELRWEAARRGETGRSAADGDLLLTYHRGDFRRTTRVVASTRAEVTATGLRWHVDLSAQGRWTTTLRVTAEDGDGDTANPPAPSAVAGLVAADDADEAAFLSAAPALRTDWADLAACYDRALRDLALLRIPVREAPGAVVPAAGLPWFLTLFGRDSLITSYFALPYLPALAAGTLRALAAVQGSVDDPAREEQPGKIVHEMRTGELTACGDLPFGRYYGTVDATPLFLVLLDEYHRWTGDDALVAELEGPARAALGWLDRFGDGYLTYQARNPEGLANQCWKDSPTSMRFADGRTAAGPIAVCEAQGYAYDARLRAARLARQVWADEPLAEACEAAAGRLRDRFARDFWLPDRDYVALALDGAGAPVDAVTSNPGHLLWSGILLPDQAEAVCRRLAEPSMSSGWGLRTMAAGDTAYNPLDYHNGTVWPHDTALVVAGLTRHGAREQAAALARDLVEAAAHFGHRLPEVFAGYPREETGVPVEFPTACSPQAWSAAAPLQLVTSLLGLTPEGVDPALPEWVGRLELEPPG